jgi:hypothetical protein
LESGPVLIKATLFYRGSQKIRIYQTFRSNAKIECPKTWKEVLKVHREELGPHCESGGYMELAPGQNHSRVLVLNYNHVIPAGKVKLKITWSVHRKDEEGRPIPDPSTTIDVNVLPATEKNLHALRDRLLDRVKYWNPSELKAADLADTILFTEHRMLLPVAWKMIENDPSKYPFGVLFSHIYKLSSPESELHERAIRLIPRLSWHEWKSYPFLYWRSHKTTLPSKCLKTLMDDADLWVRVLTYDTFGEKCDAVWVRALLAELRQAATPLPKDQFARLLVELDDDQFQTREKATTKLIQLAFRVETQLAHCDQRSLSPEAARRVRQILAAIDEQKTVSPASRVLDCLDVEEPAAQTFAILTALSEGPADSWLTKEAKVRLAAKSKGAKSTR